MDSSQPTTQQSTDHGRRHRLPIFNEFTRIDGTDKVFHNVMDCSQKYIARHAKTMHKHLQNCPVAGAARYLYLKNGQYNPEYKLQI